MDFVFMLTRGDQTVEDCLEVLDLIEPLEIKHLGFKDVGVDRRTLGKLNERIKATGAASYMEVVSTTPETCQRSARTAVEIGVDRLLGGTEFEATLAILDESGIRYYPYPGRPQGHPTRLGGTAEEIAADCRRTESLGCSGVDLLAFRAFEANPLDLIRAARAALSGDLIVAGSVDSPDRIRALAAAGVDAFTIGSAVFNGSFSPRKGSLRSQLEDVLSACS
ncbi:MAG: hypothetical protein ACE5LL_03645 [Alphaproteobacteria bacterium]